MSHKKLERSLKVILIILAFCGIVFFGYILPFMKLVFFQGIKGSPVLWIVLYELSAIPCYAVLVYGWAIAKRIGGNNSFCNENSEALKRISHLAMIDTGYFLTVTLLMLACGLNRINIIFMSMIIVFIGISISGAAAISSHLVKKATAIKEENEEII